MRYFLLLKQNLDAIKLVLAKIPHDTLNVILSQHKAKHVDDLNGNIQAIIKEYICFKEYIVSELYLFLSNLKCFKIFFFNLGCNE